MGHSTNPLILRVGISYKWNFFFIATHYIDYYTNFSIFYRLIIIYCYYLFKFKYKNLFYSIGFFLNSIRIHSNLNKKNLKFFFYFYDFNFFLIKVSLLKFFKIRTKNLIKMSQRQVHQKRLNRVRKIFLNKKFLTKIKFKNKKFLKKLLHSRKFYNFFKKKLIIWSHKNYIILNCFFKFYKNLFFTFFYKKIFLFKFLKYFCIFYFYYRRFFNLYIFLLCNYYLNLFYSKRIKLNRIFYILNKKFKFFTFYFLKKIKNLKKTNFLSSYIKIYKYFFFKYFFFYKNINMSQRLIQKMKFYYLFSFRRKNVRSFFFKYLMKIFYYNFFKNLFIKKNEKVFLNYKFLYFISYIYYRLRFLRKYKKKKIKKNLYKRLKIKIKKLKFLYYFFFIFLLFIKKGSYNIYILKKILSLYYKFGIKWFFYFIINKYLKYLYVKYYNYLKIFIYYKLKFLLKKKFNFIFSFLELKLFPVNYGVFFSSFILLLFRWKFERKFTLNQIIWPFIKSSLKKKNYIKGFFLRAAGRFTRKQRASLLKYHYGKSTFSKYTVYLLYDFITIISKHGMGGIKLWVTFSLKKKRYFNKFYLIKLY